MEKRRERIEAWRAERKKSTDGSVAQAPAAKIWSLEDDDEEDEEEEEEGASKTENVEQEEEETAVPDIADVSINLLKF